MSGIEYKLRWSGPWSWRDFDTVRLEISVGQDYHEGAKLKTTMDWARGNFNRAVIILGDTIQGYNLSIVRSMDLHAAFDTARGAGDEWLSRNKDAIRGVEVTRWDDWRNHADYPANRAAVQAMYENNDAFRTHIDDTVEGFWWRRNASVAYDDRFKTISRDFLLEETAVFASAYKELGGISAYPGSFLETWQMFIDGHVEGAPEGLKNAHWTRLQFRRRPLQAMVG